MRLLLSSFSWLINSSAVTEILASSRNFYDDLYTRSGLNLTPDEQIQHRDHFDRELKSGIRSESLESMFQRTLPVLRKSIVDAVSEAAGVTWTASNNVDRFVNQPMSFAIRQCGTMLKSARKASLPVVSHTEGDIPKFFDARKDFGPECSQLIGTAQDQSNCGSCWSFSTTTALEDRVCLSSKGKERIRLAPADTLSCCNMESGCSSFGCNGGDPASAWSWFVHEGVVTGADYGDQATCMPYPFPKCAHHVDSPDYEPCSSGSEFDTPQCVRKCTNAKYGLGYLKDKHKSVNAYSVEPSEKSIKLEIMKNGPVSAAFEVYEDFLAYTGGIYHHVTGAGVGGHAVKLIGWGEENSVKYWLLVNSWNPSCMFFI
jgi:cathepsin B